MGLLVVVTVGDGSWWMYPSSEMGHSSSEVGATTLGSGGGRAASMLRMAFAILLSHFFFFVRGSVEAMNTLW